MQYIYTRVSIHVCMCVLVDPLTLLTRKRGLIIRSSLANRGILQHLPASASRRFIPNEKAMPQVRLARRKKK